MQFSSLLHPKFVSYNSPALLHKCTNEMVTVSLIIIIHACTDSTNTLVFPLSKFLAPIRAKSYMYIIDLFEYTFSLPQTMFLVRWSFVRCCLYPINWELLVIVKINKPRSLVELQETNADYNHTRYYDNCHWPMQVFNKPSKNL